MTAPQKIRQHDWLVSAIAEHDSDDCLLWPFRVDKDGYGRVRPVGMGDITIGAHRLAFKIAFGHWPEPCALHRCDTPRCVNPRHIWEGTTADNMADRDAKKRHLFGARQAQAKLTDSVVLAAREEYAKGVTTFASLAARFCVSRAALQRAVRGKKNWKHLKSAVCLTVVRRARQTHCKNGHLLTDDNCYVYGKIRQCKTCTALRSAAKIRQTRTLRLP